MTKPGTPTHPLRVAIIGSGPAGFYAAEHLQKQADLHVQVDMYDRLPTPYGLVRGGVAPDHQKIKSVTKVYEKIASHPDFRFYGNVEFGHDITHDDLTRHYHAIIYASGAQTDRRLDVKGEDLPGSHAATEFVAWYNGHPDYRHLTFDLSQEAAVVIGVGNVAMDVARILARSNDELRETDIADYALEALAHSRVKTIYILGRRGPAQAAFTTPEIKEFGEMAEAEVVINSQDATLDPLSQQAVESEHDHTILKNIEYLQKYAVQPPQNKPKKVVFRFLVSPVEIIGTDRIEAIKIVKNELIDDGKGGLKARATDQTEVIPVGLVFRSVGYRGVPLQGVPFDSSKGTIPHQKGRVLNMAKDGEQVRGDYVAGWIKRGPSGVIGTNKPDAVETADALLEDAKAQRVLQPAQPQREAVEDLLRERGVRFVTFEDWLILDRLEQENGAETGRVRVKFTDVEQMLAALDGVRAELVG